MTVGEKLHLVNNAVIGLVVYFSLFSLVLLV